MSEPAVTGAKALQALLEGRSSFAPVADKDWTAAAGLIVKRLLISAGQTVDSLQTLRAAVGEDLFETQLKSLTHHQAKQLARRLDKAVPDLEVSTAAAAAAHVRLLLAPAPEAPADAAPDTEETEAAQAAEEAAPETGTDAASDDTSPEDPPPSNAYFGRKSFRTG